MPGGDGVATIARISNLRERHKPRTNMKSIILPLSSSLLFACAVSAAENLDALKREIEELTKRVTVLEEQNTRLKKEIEVDRLIVKKELIVSDTGQT